MEGKKQNLLAVKFVMENQTDPDNNTSANDEDSGDYLKKMFNGFSISNHNHNIERQMALEDVEAIGIACISLAPKRVVDDSKVIVTPAFIAECPLKFKPNFGVCQLISNPIKHSSVFITHASTPTEIYALIEDEELSHFRRMQEDLQLEFSSATKHSSTCCSSPIVDGNAYAFQSKDGLWNRVLIEVNEQDQLLVFHVDTGLRQVVLPTMIFHKLPERFMVLPAQAVRCILRGVFPPFTGGTTGECQFPKKICNFMRQYNGMPAFAVFEYWNVGGVGYFDRKAKEPVLRELTACVVLYPKGNSQSINLQVGRTSMARLGSKIIELPEHYEIRRRLSAQRSMESDCPSIPSTISQIKEISNNSKLNEEHAIISDVIFVRCESPDALFFRTAELMKEFLRIHNLLFAYFEYHRESIEETINFDIGFLCAIQSDRRWYRAEVIDVEEYPKITVCLIDKGFSRKVHASKIHRLPYGLDYVPRTLVQCSLSRLYPPSGTTAWNERVTHYITNELQVAESITLECRKKFDYYSPEKVTLFVTVFKTPSSSSNLNKELVSLGLATTSPSVRAAHRPAFKTTWKSSELPKVGESFSARLTWMNQKGEIFLQESRSKMELESIRQYLNEKYKDSRPTETDLWCSPGQLCIVKHTDDSNWYRGIVKHVNGREVTVYFADYGTVDVVDIQDIRLDIALEEKPVQILRCSLFNVKPVGSANQEWNLADRIAIFKESVESEFRVIVRAGGRALLQVTMVFLGTNNSHSFNRLIVDRGLAELIVDIRKNNRKKEQRIPQEGCFQRDLFTIRNDPQTYKKPWWDRSF